MENYKDLTEIFSLILAPKNNEEIKLAEKLLFQVKFRDFL